MVVPYGVPEHPHPRKMAFDAGEYGIGCLANDLKLGCDCLGQIHYLVGYIQIPAAFVILIIIQPGSFIGQDGHAIKVERAICIHEEDNGLLWKHSDYRQGGRSHAVRSRRLVISMVCTLANYGVCPFPLYLHDSLSSLLEYMFYYYFYQDGSIELEIKLSGILSVYMLAPDEPNSPFATQVAPRISGQYHQHIFSIRIDPMIDGLKNSVVETDVLPLPDPTGSQHNWAGNAFTIEDKVIAVAKEGGRDYDLLKDRRWSIVNASRKHYSSGKHPGYALGYKGAVATLLAKSDAWVARRAGFAKKSLWVVKDVQGAAEPRIWPAGRYVPQTMSPPEESVEKWATGDESLENEDLVIFSTIGTQTPL